MTNTTTARKTIRKGAGNQNPGQFNGSLGTTHATAGGTSLPVAPGSVEDDELDEEDLAVQEFSDSLSEEIPDNESADEFIRGDLVSVANFRANRVAKNFGLDSGELAGRSIERFCERYKSGREIGKPRAYLSTIMSNLAADMLRESKGKKNKADAGAWTHYKKRCEAAVEEKGRKLTRDEEDEIADAVRKNEDLYPATKHRPSVNFHRDIKVDTLFVGDDEGGYFISPAVEFAAGINARDTSSDWDQDSATIDRVHELVENKDMSTARATGFNALAEHYGLPSVDPSLPVFSGNKRPKTAHNKALEAAGGVVAGFQRWINDDLTLDPEAGLSPAENARRTDIVALRDALFAPWARSGRTLTIDEKDLIAVYFAETLVDATNADQSAQMHEALIGATFRTPEYHKKKNAAVTTAAPKATRSDRIKAKSRALAPSTKAVV